MPIKEDRVTGVEPSLIERAFQYGLPTALLVGLVIGLYKILKPISDRMLEGHLKLVSDACATMNSNSRSLEEQVGSLRSVQGSLEKVERSLELMQRRLEMIDPPKRRDRPPLAP